MEQENKFKRLGEKLKEIRRILGLTQTELAEKVGINQVSITRLESGGNVGVSILLDVLTFYSQYVSIDVLFDENAWNMASQDREMLLKKVHINSIIHAKLTLMKKHLLDTLHVQRDEQAAREQEFENYIRRGMDSAISMLDDE